MQALYLRSLYLPTSTFFGNCYIKMIKKWHNLKHTVYIQELCLLLQLKTYVTNFFLRSSDSQEIPHLLRNQKFFTAFTRAIHVQLPV
jgi:hypothetical protein